MAVESPRPRRWSVLLPEVLTGLLTLVELGGQCLGGPLPEGLLDEPAGVPALAAAEALGLDGGLALRRDDKLDGLAQEPPPTVMVNLTLPSGRGCSKTLWPRFLASIVALQIA
jgi:hypothetical protein